MEYDLQIAGGLIVDGSGGPSFRGEVAVKAGRITTPQKSKGQPPEGISFTRRYVDRGPDVVDAEGPLPSKVLRSRAAERAPHMKPNLNRLSGSLS